MLALLHYLELVVTGGLFAMMWSQLMRSTAAPHNTPVWSCDMVLLEWTMVAHRQPTPCLGGGALRERWIYIFVGPEAT